MHYYYNYYRFTAPCSVRDHPGEPVPDTVPRWTQLSTLRGTVKWVLVNAREQSREIHLCRVAVNTVWSHMTSDLSSALEVCFKQDVLNKLMFTLLCFTQPFYGSLDFVGTNQVSRYQKKHSPTHTYRGHQSSFICFLQYNLWDPPCSIHVSNSLFSQSPSKFSLVYLLAWHLHFIFDTFLHSIIVFFSQHMPKCMQQKHGL